MSFRGQRARALSLILLLSLPLLLHAQSTAWQNSPAIESRIDQLLGQMTLEEKIGQLNQYSAGMPTGPGTGRSNYEEMIARGEIGSILNLVGPEKVNAMQRVAVEKSRLHIPILFSLDVIHGYRTTFPIPLGLSATWDTSLVEQSMRLAARESVEQGIRWTFSPMVDIARDARWGRIAESNGEDPYLGQAMARAYVRGYQGSLDPASSMAACAKHYIGYGAAEAGRDYNATEISEHALREFYLPPFQAAADEGAMTFMSSFNTINGVPATANAHTLRQILREEWKYPGLVVSDWGAVGELMPHGLANDGRTAARRALLAGVDMDMESSLYLSHVASLVRSGEVPEKVLDQSVRNVLRIKFALGLFEHPYATAATSDESPLTADARALTRRAAEESFVLLKNSAIGGHALLPLEAKKGSTIAVIGPLAGSAHDMLGSWFTKGRDADVVTLRTALEQFAAQHEMHVIFEDGVAIRGGGTDFSKAVAAAKKADVVLLTLGEEGETMTGEATSRAFLGLPGHQEELLSAVSAVGKPTALLLFSGRPLALTPVEPKVQAILEAWFPGIEAGPALVETLFGQAAPGGRLTASFPRSVGQEPLYYDELSTGRPVGGVDLTHPPTNAEEKYHSRYIDELNAPLYPFGYGLTYTNFVISEPKLSTPRLSAKALNAGETALKVTATVTNRGARQGDEVVQLYLNQRGTSVARPLRELKGFERLTLKAGESRTVEFTLGAAELKFWNVDGRFTAEPSEATVWVGEDSTDGQPVKFTITD